MNFTLKSKYAYYHVEIIYKESRNIPKIPSNGSEMEPNIIQQKYKKSNEHYNCNTLIRHTFLMLPHADRRLDKHYSSK